MAVLAVETRRWRFHNKNASVELSVFCRFLIHVVQINARKMERIKKNSGNIAYSSSSVHNYTQSDTLH